jgi:hypothetical protein
MNHYVYRVDRPATGEFYIGIRSCKGNPSEDTYFGSGVHIRRIPTTELVKTILVVVQSRARAARIEKTLVTKELLEDPLCLNLTTGGEFNDPRHPAEETRAKLKAAWTQERREELRLTNRVRQRRLEEGRRLQRVAAAKGDTTRSMLGGKSLGSA